MAQIAISGPESGLFSYVGNCLFELFKISHKIRLSELTQTLVKQKLLKYFLWKFHVMVKWTIFRPKVGSFTHISRTVHCICFYAFIWNFVQKCIVDLFFQKLFSAVKKKLFCLIFAPQTTFMDISLKQHKLFWNFAQSLSI